MIGDDKWRQIGDCVWKLAETEGFIQTDDKGNRQLYCNREWLIEAYRRCEQQLFPDDSSTAC